MKNETNRKIVNVDKSNYSPLFTFKQEDDAVIKLSLFKDSTALNLVGQTIKFYAKRSNNTIVELLDGFIINNNNLDITLKNNILAIPGLVECDLEIVDAVGKMTTASFYLTVNKKMTGEENLSATNDISALNKIIAQVEAGYNQLDSDVNALSIKAVTKLDEVQEDYNLIKQGINDDESIRKANENARLTSETNRGNSENTRITNESNRVAAENLRITKENDRISKENTRVTNEDTRISNENNRIANEDTRVSSENTRTTNENTRVSNESTRISKETARVSAETSRVTAETNRVNAEALRVTAENTRGTNETARVNAENIRVTNETARQTAYKEIQDARKDFDGNVCSSIYEAKMKDLGNVYERFNEASLLEYTGTDITTNNSYKGLVKNLSVKGRSLQNLMCNCIDNTCFNNYIHWLVPTTNTFTVDANGTNRFLFIKKDNVLLKPSTNYTIVLEVLENTLTGTYSYTLFGSSGLFNGSAIALTSETLKTTKFLRTTVSDFSTRLHSIDSYLSSSATGGRLTVRFTILEGDYTNTPLSEIPYIDGIKSVGELENKVVLKSCGKNLFDISKWANIPFTRATGSVDCIKDTITIIPTEADGFTDSGIRTSGYLDEKYKPLSIKVKPNTSYSIKFNRTLSGDSDAWVYFNEYDSNYNFIKIFSINIVNKQFTTSNNAKYITMRFGVSTIGVTAIYSNIQLEENTTATTYETYQGSKQELTLTEPLRSLPNGICDEIIGDKLIRRVGKIVLNGSENWSIWQDGSKPITSLIIGMAMVLSLAPSTRSFYAMCDKVPSYLPNDDTSYTTSKHPYYSTLFENCYGYYANSTTNKRLAIGILKSKLNTVDLAGFKTWLSQNPTTVYYELETPTTTTISPLIINSYDGVTHITSDNYLLPKITTKVPSNVQAVVTNLMNENQELNNQISVMSLESEENSLTNIETNLNNDVRITMLELGL